MPDTPSRNGLPDTKVACLYSAFPDDAETTSWIDVIYAQLKEKNYDVYPPVKKATVADLMALPPCSVFGLAAHGFVRDAYDNPEPCIYTADEYNDENVARYKSLLEAKPPRLVKYHKEEGDTVEHLGITAAFIQDYWKDKFASNGFVYLDTCHGGSEKTGEIRDAILYAGKASLVAGWSLISYGLVGPQTAAYVFSRMLGEDIIQTGTGVPDENPPQRPFRYSDLKEDIERKKLGRFFDPKYKQDTVFGFFEGAGDFALLAPSIAYLDMEDDTKKLTLTGIFGNKPGEVHVGKAPNGADNPKVAIDDWSATSITCTLPDAGETASGRVTIHVNDIESNPRFLTEWRGNTSYEYVMNEPPVSGNIQGNLKLAVNTTVHFRADVADYREKPGEDPKYRDMVYVHGAEDSKGSWKAKGDLSILTPIKRDELIYREQWDSEGTLEVKRYGEFYLWAGLCPYIFTVPVEFDVQAQDAFQAKTEVHMIGLPIDNGRDVKLLIPPEWRADSNPYPMAIYDSSDYRIPELRKGPTAYIAPVPFIWLSENPLIRPKYTITYKRDEIPATEDTVPETDAAR